MSKEQSENLLYSLSSLYRDFLPVDNSLLKLYEVYAKIIDYGWDVFREAGDSKAISTTRTLSNIPYFKVDVDSARYDLDTASMLSKMNIEDQISYLDKESLYTSFVFTRKDAAGDPIVYSMRLMTNFYDTEPLKLFEDYFVRSNRLYLLPKFIQSRKQVFHYLHAFDIKVNDLTLEKNFGSRFSLNAGPLLTRYEYRDFLEAYSRAFQGNLTIKEIKNSIRLATKWETFSIEDWKSPTISPTKLQLYKNLWISPFKFLVSLPEELIAEKIKVNIVRTLLNELKEVQTDYMVFYDIRRFDEYPVPMKDTSTVSYDLLNKLSPDDAFKVGKSMVRVTENPFDFFGRYDSSFYYNQNLGYDDPPTHEVIGLQQDVNQKDDLNAFGNVSVIHHTLMIPRNFHTTDTADSFIFSCDSNQDTTTEFELYASMVMDGPFDLIETTPNDKQAATITFVHNAMGSGYLYYKSRAKDPDRTSLFTLPYLLHVHIPLFDDSDMLDDSYLIDDSRLFDETDGEETLISYVLGITVY